MRKGLLTVRKNMYNFANETDYGTGCRHTTSKDTRDRTDS